MQEKVKAAIAKYNMLSAGDRVCTALSGGADSVALLLVLHGLSAELGITLCAVHINHMLRDEESDRDENFCRCLCKRLDIPLTVYREDAAAFSRALGVSVETGARELRYKLFDTVNVDRIATAHNLNDNAETVLFRLARGTGLKGLTGIPPVRGRVIRPLIECTREEIEAYLAAKGQDFVTDSTNLSDDYTRNRIRHRIMPEMAQVHSAFPRCITETTISLAEDEDYLQEQARVSENGDLRQLHPAVRKRVIINLLKDNGIEVSAAAVSAVDGILLSGGGKVGLGRDTFAISRDGRLKITAAENDELPEIMPQNITKCGKYHFYGDKFVIISKLNGEIVNANGNVNKKLTTMYADYDKIQGVAVLRNRRRSDKLKPAGQAHTRELRKLLQERLPPGERAVSAVIEDESGIVWAEHAGFADRVKADENTENYLVIEITT